MEIVSIVASIVSVAIAGFAIWLSVTFFRMSTKTSAHINEAAKGIASGVDKLEKLFDRLYADTFSMMRDTVSDMRKHIWPEKEPTEDVSEIAEEKANEKIKEFRKEIKSELSAMLAKLGRTDTKLTGAEDNIQRLIDRVIKQSRRVEKDALTETLRDEILEKLPILSSPKRDIITADTVVGSIRGEFNVSEILKQLIQLQKEGIIKLPPDVREADDILPSTPIQVR